MTHGRFSTSAWPVCSCWCVLYTDRLTLRMNIQSINWLIYLFRNTAKTLDRTPRKHKPLLRCPYNNVSRNDKWQNTKITVLLNTAKDHKGLHRTAKDPRKTAKDLTEPLLFVYFLFCYQKRWINMKAYKGSSRLRKPARCDHSVVLSSNGTWSWNECIYSTSSKSSSWTPISATHSHWHRQHDDVGLRSLCSSNDELSDLAVLCGPVRSSWNPGSTLRFYTQSFAVFWEGSVLAVDRRSTRKCRKITRSRSAIYAFTKTTSGRSAIYP